MYLGLDLGTSAVKALLIDENGTQIGSRKATLNVIRPHPGWSEQDPEQWWEATNRAVLALRDDFPNHMAAVQGIGLSGQMHGLTALDDEDRILRPAILWNDMRSASQARQLDVSKPAFRELGGNAVMPGFTAPKAVWMAENEPHLFDRIRTILLPKDYLRLRLSGEKFSDMSDAAGTLWLDITSRNWSDRLLDASGLSTSAMPELVEGNQPAGQLRRDMASAWGIAGQPVIAGGAGDNAAAAIGLGIIRGTDSFLSLGTSGVVFTVTDQFTPAPQRGVHAFCHALPDTWHAMGVILAASDCVSWLCEITGVGVEALMTELDEAEAQGRPDGSDLLFHPYLSGERTPHNDANARAGFFGLTRSHTRADMTRAVLQGASFAIADAVSALKGAGATPEDLLATGGGAINLRWLRYIASVTGTTIHLPHDGDYGAALGAARLAMMATGAQISDVCSRPSLKTSITPDAALADKLHPAYERWQQLYEVINA